MQPMQHEMQHEDDTIFSPQCSAGEFFNIEAKFSSKIPYSSFVCSSTVTT